MKCQLSHVVYIPERYFDAAGTEDADGGCRVEDLNGLKDRTWLDLEEDKTLTGLSETDLCTFGGLEPEIIWTFSEGFMNENSYVVLLCEASAPRSPL